MKERHKSDDERRDDEKRWVSHQQVERERWRRINDEREEEARWNTKTMSSRRRRSNEHKRDTRQRHGLRHMDEDGVKDYLV